MEIMLVIRPGFTGMTGEKQESISMVTITRILMIFYQYDATG